MTWRQTVLFGAFTLVGLFLGSLYGEHSWAQRKEGEEPKPEPPVAVGRYRPTVMGNSFIMTDTVTGQSWFCDFQAQNPTWADFTPKVKGKK
jgi:hypothetical protein